MKSVATKRRHSDVRRSDEATKRRSDVRRVGQFGGRTPSAASHLHWKLVDGIGRGK